MRIFIFYFALQINTHSYQQIKTDFVSDLPEFLNESSGLISYESKFLITHNDGGNPSELFILNYQGEILNKINLRNTKNKDWEDLAVSKEGDLFIGDFGNNINQRKDLKIYILRKGFIDSTSVNPEVIKFKYEDQFDFPPEKQSLNFDCEAMTIIGDSIYLFTKCRTEPFTGICNIYSLPKTTGNFVAKKRLSINLCSIDWRFCSVTSADYFVANEILVLLTYSRLYVIVDFNPTNLSYSHIHSISLPFLKQRESICFYDYTTLYMTDEYRKGLGGGNLYQLKLILP